MTKLTTLLLSGMISLYAGCMSTNPTYTVPSSAGCTSNNDCKAGRICDLVQKQCVWSQSNVNSYDIVQPTYDAGSVVDVTEKDVVQDTSSSGYDAESIDYAVQEVQQIPEVSGKDVGAEAISSKDSWEAEVQNSYLKGDVNCDGSIDLADYGILKKKVLAGDTSGFTDNNGNPCGTGQSLGDVNCDESIDLADYGILKKKVLAGDTSGFTDNNGNPCK